MAASKTFAFAFPAASGHLNPSLAIARCLVESGHSVHFLNVDAMRTAIESTGAEYHALEEYSKELMAKPELGVVGNLMNLCKEAGLEPSARSFELLKSVMLEKKLPGVLRFLKSLAADALVYCPLINIEAGLAAKVFGIPSVSLNTCAGPGALTTMFHALRETLQEDTEEFIERANTFEPELAANRRLNAKFGICLQPGVELPIGKSSTFGHATLNLVTTSSDLMDPMTPELERAYAAEGVGFVGVGPLLDREGVKRAAGHRLNASAGETQPAHAVAESGDAVLTKVRGAHADGRSVVLVSMGTVITGDFPGMGWEGRKLGADGRPRGLTGRELCQAVWGGAFDAFGAGTESEGPLLVVALGPQDRPLGDIVAPPNALCAPALPQVDLLRAGVDLFLTHGGQNSFTESLLHGTPVVVCPGAGDQIVNASKAVALGVGLKVDRPDPQAGGEEEAAAAYRAEVCRTLREVSGQPAFVEAARACSERLQLAGGVPRAVELILAVSDGVVDKRRLGKDGTAASTQRSCCPAPVAGA